MIIILIRTKFKVGEALGVEGSAAGRPILVDWDQRPLQGRFQTPVVYLQEVREKLGDCLPQTIINEEAIGRHS